MAFFRDRYLSFPLVFTSSRSAVTRSTIPRMFFLYTCLKSTQCPQNTVDIIFALQSLVTIVLFTYAIMPFFLRTRTQFNVSKKCPKRQHLTLDYKIHIFKSINRGKSLWPVLVQPGDFALILVTLVTSKRPGPSLNASCCFVLCVNMYIYETNDISYPPQKYAFICSNTGVLCQL